MVHIQKTMDEQNECEKSSGDEVSESNNGRRYYDVIIVGAGVAGSSLAHTLGKDGRLVHLIERNLSEPNRFVGEILQPGGYLKLIDLGLEDCVNDGIDAQVVLGYEIYSEGKSVTVPYPLKNFRFDVAGRCCYNGRFVQSLRQKAASLSNVVLEQGTVTSLLKERGTTIGVEYKTKAGQRISSYAPLTIVCDGCHSSLRRYLCEPKVTVFSHFVAVLLKNCELPHKNYAHVILGDHPMVFYPVSSTEVRFIIDLPEKKLPSVASGDMAQYLKTFARHVPLKLHDAFFSAIDTGQIRTMETKYMPAMAYPTPGALLLGDALTMRHPITGTGVTAALYDVVLIRDLLRPLNNLHDTYAVAKVVTHFYTKRKPVSFWLNAVANLSYKSIQAAPGGANKYFERGFFSYLRFGGYFSDGAALLVSGINPSLLTMSFQSILLVSYFTAWFLLQFPSPQTVSSVTRLSLDMLALFLDHVAVEVRQGFLAPNDPAHEETSPTTPDHQGIATATRFSF